MRRVAYCLMRQRSEFLQKYIAAGLAKCGYSVRYALDDEFSVDDLLVTWTPWRGSIADRIGERHRAVGGMWIVFENGYIPNDAKGNRYYCAGLNGFNGLGDHQNKDSTGDRFHALRRPIRPWRTSGSHIVLIGQMGGVDERYTMPLDWIDDVIRRIAAVTSRPIHYLPKRQRPQYPVRMSARVQMPNETLHEALQDAWALVTFNSKCVLESLLNGIPAFYDGFNSIAQDWIQYNVEEIETPVLFAREQLFYDVSYAQWSVYEIAAGMPFKKLCPNILKEAVNE